MRLFPALLLTVSVVAGCGALDVSDPTAIEDSELSNANGALLLHGDALRRLAVGTTRGAFMSGVIADEFVYDAPPWFPPLSTLDELLDRRDATPYTSQQASDAASRFGAWQEARRAATLAMPKLRIYGPSRAYLGEMFAARGLVTLQIAESYCPGFPLHEIDEYQPVFGPPLSTAEAFEKAVADLDSALVYAADSARILNFARVARARALVGLGQFEEAAAAVAPVPTDYLYQVEFNAPSNANQLAFESAFLGQGVADQEGGTGLDFISAGDPRLSVDPLGAGPDGVTVLYRAAKYPDGNAPMVAASGVEARLIEAEAALKASPESGEWLTILNELRTTGAQDDDGMYQPGTGGVPGLAPLADPGTATGREDLLFRERAFWLFGTGHRLGDLRRLVARYGRAPESVFPTGTYRHGGTYGTATNIAFVAEQEAPFNPAITGCTDR